MRIIKSLLSGVFCLFLTSQPLFAQKFVRVNQIGYLANMPKYAMVAGFNASSYEIRNAKNDEVVYQGTISDTDGKYWNLSKETIQEFDFSDFQKPGEYYIQIGTEMSYVFTIQEKDLFRELSQSVIRAFYYWRSSCAIEAPYSLFRGKDFSRPMGHPDTMVFIHKTAASTDRHVGQVVSSPKGWYDAGDYNKYVVNAGITLHQMLTAYQLFPDYYNHLLLNIPQDGDSSWCDYYREIRWETDWLLTMQDPADGGVYHKLTTLRFSGFVMPHEDVADRYMIRKSTAAALDFAAVMAKLSYTFKEVDPAYCKKALTAAVRAWNWAEKNPAVLYQNPEDVRTGSYADDDVSDEFFWAASELLVATGEKKYYEKLDFFRKFDIPQWRYVNSLGLLSLRQNMDRLPKFVDKETIQRKFHSLAQSTYNLFSFSAGRVALKHFEWGSNGDIAMNGGILGLAYLLEGDEKYKTAMLGNFDYLMGANPTDYCFVSVFGNKCPKNLHDRRSSADGITEAIPGYLCGGANANQVSDCGRSNYPSTAPARCYLDEQCSYSTNEIAVNWNAPLVLLTAMVENIAEK